MGEFGNQQNDPTTKGELDPSEVKLFNMIQQSVMKAEDLAEKWVHADNKGKDDIMFEVGFCLFQDLNNRLCLCQFPVHVCMNDITPEGRLDGVRRMKKYLLNKFHVDTPPDATAPLVAIGESNAPKL